MMSKLKRALYVSGTAAIVAAVCWAASTSGPVGADAAGYAWHAAAAPEYYKVTGKARFDDMPAVGKVEYSALDALGRTRKARANVTYEMTQQGREAFEEGCEPSGWGGNRQVTIESTSLFGKAYSGYFWNRSHLIAAKLGGDAKRHNLVKGTRTQNVGANDGSGGMQYAETRAWKWLACHRKGHVLYSAEPVYSGRELVPRAVLVDMRTSDGSIDEHIVVYNAALGYEVDYARGGFSKAAGPARPGSPKASSAKGKATLRWKAVKNADGYRVAWRLKGSSKWSYRNVTKTSATIKKLEGGERYQLKVRSRKLAGGEWRYSSWTKAKTVKVK